MASPQALTSKRFIIMKFLKTLLFVSFATLAIASFSCSKAEPKAEGKTQVEGGKKADGTKNADAGVKKD